MNRRDRLKTNGLVYLGPSKPGVKDKLKAIGGVPVQEKRGWVWYVPPQQYAQAKEILNEAPDAQHKDPYGHWNEAADWARRAEEGWGPGAF
jgi:hypothetical protein